jgi:hypothetical protein
MRSPTQKKIMEQTAITNPQALKARMSEKMLPLYAVIPVLMGSHGAGRVRLLPLITAGKFPEACFEFVIPSQEGIHDGCPFSRA